MKKVLIILACTLFLLSCAPVGEERATREWRVGSEGIVMRFLPNMPPQQVYDDEQMNIVLELENRGATEAGIANDRVYLSGYDPSIITGISTFGEVLPFMEGKSQYNPIGTKDFVSFTAVPTNLNARGIDKYPFIMQATACYAYRTIASDNVCIDPDPFAPTTKQKICTPQPVAMGSQGAPIAVTDVEVEASPGRTRFRINMQNLGGGRVYRAGPEFLNKCSPYDQFGLEFNEVGYVRLDKVEVSGQDITASCRPMDINHIRLNNGLGTIVCEFRSFKGGAAYVTPLVIGLSYGYEHVINVPVEVLSTE